MRIVSLMPFLSEVVCSLGLRESLVGISHQCDYPEELKDLTPITREGSSKEELAGLLSSKSVDMTALLALRPTHILGSVPDGAGVDQKAVEARLRSLVGLEAVKFLSFSPVRLNQVYSLFEDLGTALDKGAKGRECAQRAKAQIMDWCSNFNERTRSKKVTFLSSLNPLRVAAQWVPDLLALASCQSQCPAGESGDKEVTWDDVRSFAPHVLMIAPRDMDGKSACKLLSSLEKLPGWSDLPAVKRGEVVFAGGKDLYRTSMRIVDSAAIVLSAIGGMESGYITPRESFFRLRWVEMQRHRL